MKKRFFRFSKSISNFITDFLDGDFFGLAAEMSFYILSALFPMIVMIVTAASAISLNYTDTLLHALETLPHQISDLLINLISSPIKSSTVIAITGVFTMFTMSGLISTVEKALNRFYKLENNRSYITSKSIALFFSILIFISIIASFGLVIFGKLIGTSIENITSNREIISLWNTSRYIVVVLFIVMVISALYKAMPTVKVRIRDVIPGALFTTVMWYVSSVLFALYVNNFPQYEIIYGSLAGFVCLIMWIYLIGISFVSGAKINGMLYHHMLKVMEKKKEIEIEETDVIPVEEG